MNADLALLMLRLGAGGMMFYAHGLQKLQRFSEFSTQFPDPIGLGSTFALILTIFAELICSGLVALGIKTRYSSIPVVITMLVAVFVIHANDPLQKKELAILYLLAFGVLAISGGGKYSFPSFAEKLKKLE